MEVSLRMVLIVSCTDGLKVGKKFFSMLQILP
jgi:hypothetical protein